MLIVMDESFHGKRPKVKEAIVDLIQKTSDKICDAGEELTVTVADANFSWEKYNKDHNVCLLFTSKPNLQWYWSDHSKMYIVECYSPSKVISWAEGYPEFFYAFEKAYNFDLYKELSERVKNIEYHVVKDFSDPVFMHVVKNCCLLGCDIETRGFAWQTMDILVHGYCYEQGKVMIVPQTVVDASPENKEIFKQFMESKKHIFIWQNGKFDVKWYRVRDIDARVDHDTMLMSYGLDERSGGKLNLEYLSTKYLNADSYKHKIKFETVDPMDKDLHYYLAQDCCYTKEIFLHLSNVLDKPENAHTKKLYNTILLKASWALTRLEEGGFYVNQEHTSKLEKTYSDKLATQKDVLSKVAEDAGFNGDDYIKWSGAKSYPDKFNCNSTKQLAYVLIGLLKLPKYKGKISTDKPTMLHWLFKILKFPNPDEYTFMETDEKIVSKWLVSDPDTAGTKEFLWNLLSYRKLKKMHSTYILNALNYSQADGRVHVSFKIHGTVTGRLSSGDPMNLQNIPRQKDIKNIFTAPEGKTLMECDYSQAELRVLGFLSQDPTILQTYWDDGDLHDNVAAKVFGPDFTKEQRVGAKTINFGLAYGRGVASVAEQIGCSIPEAQKLVDAWAEGMPVAWDFIQDTRKKPALGEKCITPLGREKRFWLINHKNENKSENESINFPIQSFASDCTLMALYDFLKKMEADPIKYKDVLPVNIVHDAILVEAPDNKVDMVMEELTDCMSQVPGRLVEHLNIPMKADGEATKKGWGSKSDYDVYRYDITKDCGTAMSQDQIEAMLKRYGMLKADDSVVEFKVNKTEEYYKSSKRGLLYEKLGYQPTELYVKYSTPSSKKPKYLVDIIIHDHKLQRVGDLM